MQYFPVLNRSNKLVAASLAAQPSIGILYYGQTSGQYQMLYYQRELLQPLLCQQTETILGTEELLRIERQAQSIEQFKKQISLHLSEYYSSRVC